MGNTMTPMEELEKAGAQAFKEYMRDIASARRTRTRRKNRAEALFQEAILPAREEWNRKRAAIWDEFAKEVEESRE